MADRTCTAPGCDRKVVARGLCGRHYYYWWNYGTIDDHDRRKDRPSNLATASSVHHYLRKYRGPASSHECVDCGAPAVHWSYDTGCPDEMVQKGRHGPGSIRRFCPHPMEDYSPRCRKCHDKLDGPTKWRKGSHHGRAKLTEDDVRDARARHADGESTYLLAQEYGVDSKTMHSAIRRETWKHIE
jgi:hypothetical protein